MIGIWSARTGLPLKSSLRILLLWCLVVFGFTVILLHNFKGFKGEESRIDGSFKSCSFANQFSLTDIIAEGHSFTTNSLIESQRISQSNVVDDESNTKAEQEITEVFLVLHSHVDPGWLKTFDEYYNEKVESILKFAVRYLNQEPSLRFIWSEISFLEKWWQNATLQERNDLLKVVKSGQFEMTGGAWVMTDEATPYYWASIDNLIEGHQFLADQLNVSPTTSWSVDPFGHGAMMPYLLHLAGVKKMAIGRVNNDHKALMRDRQQLVFRWRQKWDTNGLKDNWVHTLPRTYYTTWDSCGPDRGICCQYEFGPSAVVHCNNRQPITPKNVDEFAAQLVENYGQIASLYRSNTLLVAVGDDFYLSQEADWTENIKNYGALIKHINANSKRFSMKIQFGTLSEYFNALGSPTDFPTLSGDFFPYMDSPNPSSYPWWTGYFTTRPYHKRLERIIQSRLRGTDLLSAFAPDSGDWHKSVKPRRDLALFQHHDAITGTSKAYVMDDYLDRLLKSMQAIKKKTNELATSLLIVKKSSKKSDKCLLNEIVTDGEVYENLTSTPLTIPLHKKAEIIVYNQLTRRHTQVVRLVVRVPTIKVVRKSDRSTVVAQINPIIRNGDIVAGSFEIVFLVDSESLSLTVYELENVGHQPKSTSMATISYDKCPTHSGKVAGFKCELLISKQITIGNDYMSITVDLNLTTGSTIQNVNLMEQNNGIPLSMSFWTYADDGGTYTFKPARPAELVISKNSAILIRGPIVAEMTAKVSDLLTQTISLFKSAGVLGRGIHISLRPNMASVRSASIVARIETAPKFGHRFFTDVNGLYLLERRHDSEKPIEVDHT